MSERSPLSWLVLLVGLGLLWPLVDPALNRALFLTLNGLAARLPDLVWSDLTVLGDTLVAMVLLLPLMRRRPDLVLAALLASLPATLLSHGLKNALAMARPYAVLADQVHVVGPYLKAGSFPSGHTTTIFVLACTLALGLRNRSAAAWLLALAALVGLSRVAVGAHWPLDVAGGILCGWLSGLIGLYLVERFPGMLRPTLASALRLLLVACALVLLVRYDTGYPLARPFEQALALLALVFHLLPGWRLPARGAA
ncbi:phosphatase PAP2 family protein [Parasulfuritortus cantonensis]|uniref:Phosphatase PAP2 family protein n=1 Tax=Parasulfuritortus cantonensis TaxID=2528202 RepID=A0A4R1BM68_9PROT|nr:phosphatase PAP2 family protein [Parasulfuritortus cantonensis]TCJ18504.1 phosphatase PAP2 family protein [Parasulfuritortus cantonensis]